MRGSVYAPAPPKLTALTYRAPYTSGFVAFYTDKQPCARRDACVALAKASLAKKMTPALRSAMTGTKKEQADKVRAKDAEYVTAVTAPFFDDEASTTVSLDIVGRLPEQLKVHLSAETKQAMQVVPHHP